MIAYLIADLDVRGGTHKQFLKLLEYTEAQGEPFFIVAMRVDFDKTYPGFKKYSHLIRLFEPEPKSSSMPIARYKRLRRNCAKLASLLQDADVINLHDGGYDGYLSAFDGIPTVWQINDLNPAFRVGVASKQKDSPGKWLSRKLFLHKLKYIDEITVNVTKNAERIKEKLHRDAKVLYCGIEPMSITHSIDDSLNRFGKKQINLLSSGVWFPYRNYETQVKTVKLLLDKGYDVKLNIIGTTQYSPAYYQQIDQMIKDYNLADRIKICGMVDEAEFINLHQQADIFLFINVDQSWGLAVFEAMSCGIPVIVSESVGATEILHDGRDALFVNPLSPEAVADKIISLVSDPNEYRKLSETSAKFHHDYTWDKAYSSKMLDILKAKIDNRSDKK